MSMERLMEKKSRFLTENFVIETNDPGSVSHLLLCVSETFYQKLRSQLESHSDFLSSANESVDLQQTTKRSWSSLSKLNFCQRTSKLWPEEYSENLATEMFWKGKKDNRRNFASDMNLPCPLHTELVVSCVVRPLVSLVSLVTCMVCPL